MSFITDLEKLAKPTTVCAYIDKVQFWLFDPLDQATLSWLEKNCGRGRLHTETKHARWDPKYR